MGNVLWIPAHGGHHRHLVLCIPLMQLLIARMRDDVNGEVLDELREVAPNVGHRDVQRFLQLEEPVAISDLLGGKQVLMLGHLPEAI